MKRRRLLLLPMVLILVFMLTTGAYASTVKAKSVSVSPVSATIYVGDTVTLKATKNPSKSNEKIAWKSSNKSVATVTSKGLVKGVSDGIATITATTSITKKKASCKVIVKDFATKKDVASMLKETSVTDEHIVSLIEKHTKNDNGFIQFIKDTVAGEYLSKDSAKVFIDEYLSESEYITKAEAEKLVSENTYTEEEIKALVEKYSSNTSDNDDWEGVQELKFDNPQILPYKRSAGNKYNMTVESLKVTKERFERLLPNDDNINNMYATGAYYKYKYNVEANVNVETNVNVSERATYGIVILLLDNNRVLEQIDYFERIKIGENLLKFEAYSNSDCGEFLLFSTESYDDES